MNKYFSVILALLIVTNIIYTYFLFKNNNVRDKKFIDYKWENRGNNSNKKEVSYKLKKEVYHKKEGVITTTWRGSSRILKKEDKLNESNFSNYQLYIDGVPNIYFNEGKSFDIFRIAGEYEYLLVDLNKDHIYDQLLVTAKGKFKEGYYFKEADIEPFTKEQYMRELKLQNGNLPVETVK